MTNAAARFSDLPTRPITTIFSLALQAPPGIAADLAHAHRRVDRAIRDRKRSDIRLINYWRYLFLVSWSTLGVYAIVLYAHRVNRADRFSQRKLAYWHGLVDWTDRYAQQHGSDGQLQHRLAELRAQVSAAYTGRLRRIGAGRSLALTALTLGIFGLYVRYRENRYWSDAWRVEREFHGRLWSTWAGLRITRYPIAFAAPPPTGPRNFRGQLILTILTLGVWGIVWSYRTHIDPENLYRELHPVEDWVLRTIRTHSGG